MVGLSISTMLRRHTYTFEEFYKITSMTGLFGMAIYYAMVESQYLAYFNKGEKYQTENALKNECQICWTFKGWLGWIIFAAYGPIGSIFFIAEVSDKYRLRGGSNLNDIFTTKYWTFWKRVSFENIWHYRKFRLIGKIGEKSPVIGKI